MSALLDRPGPVSELASLNYGMLAVALNASGMPDRKQRPAPDTAQLAAWARQGLDRLGLAEVRRLDARTRALGYWYEYGGHPDRLTRAERAEFRRMWLSTRRRNVAHDHAYRLASDMRPPYWLARRRALGLARPASGSPA